MQARCNKAYLILVCEPTPVDITWHWRSVVANFATTLENVEAEPGIEPGLADLQSASFFI